MRLTALWHQVYDLDRLRAAYPGRTRAAPPGGEGQTGAAYGDHLEANLRDLSDRRTRGTSPARPVARVYLPTPDGRQRPIGIPTLEAKLAQRATVEGLNALDEGAFLGFADGFRPGRSPHEARDAVPVGIEKCSRNGVLDADRRGFFAARAHGWLVQFVEPRLGERRVVRQLWKWLKAGGRADGTGRARAEGTPPGGRVSPVAATIYLHYVLELWAERWRRRNARGEMIIVRSGDAFGAGFAHRGDAERCWTDLRARCQPFKLALHPEKTRLLEVGRLAAERRQRRGQGHPATCDFLGFTHICSQTRTGKLTGRRKTIAKRRRQQLQEVKAALRRRMHDPIPRQGAWRGSGLRGPDRASGVPRNSSLRAVVHDRVMRDWWQTLRRRRQRPRITWPRRDALAEPWRPPPQIVPPDPAPRLRGTTRGRSPVRSCRTPGAVRGGGG